MPSVFPRLDGLAGLTMDDFAALYRFVAFSGPITRKLG
jgi:hypothetical protein